jgi:hypothetical protein
MANNFLGQFPYKDLNLTPIEITDIKSNRSLLKIHGYKKAGIYVWLMPDKQLYVGRSINLYARIQSYFYRIPKYKGVSKVRNYLNKYGFSSVRLILFIFREKHTFNELVNAEQTFLDFLKPTLNLDSRATPSRYNQVMQSQTYEKFLKNRSHSVAVFDSITNELLWVFETKQFCIKAMNIHHSTLNKCVNTKATYLNNFRFSVTDKTNGPYKNLNNFLDLVKEKRKQFKSYKHRNKKAQKVCMEHIINPAFSRRFESQRDCAKFLNADRETIRKYIKNPELGYFRKVWKFKIVN